MSVVHDAGARTVVLTRGHDSVVVNMGAAPVWLDLPAEDGAAVDIVLAWQPQETVLEAGRIRVPAESAAVLSLDVAG